MQRQMPNTLDEWDNQLITCVITDDVDGLECLARSAFYTTPLPIPDYEELVIKAAAHHAVNVLEYLINRTRYPAHTCISTDKWVKITVNDRIFAQCIPHLNASLDNYPVDFNYNLYNDFQFITEFNSKKDQDKKAQDKKAHREVVFSASETPSEVLEIICGHMEIIEKRAKVIEIIATEYIQTIHYHFAEENKIKIICSVLSLVNNAPYLNENYRKEITRQCIFSIIGGATDNTLRYCTPFIESTDMLQSLINKCHLTLGALLKTIDDNAQTPSGNFFYRSFVNAFFKNEAAELCRKISDQYYSKLYLKGECTIFSKLQLLHDIIIQTGNPRCNSPTGRNETVIDMMAGLLNQFAKGTYGIFNVTMVRDEDGSDRFYSVDSSHTIKYFEQLEAKPCFKHGC